MRPSDRSSRQRFTKYKHELKERRSRGDLTPAHKAAAHAAVSASASTAAPGSPHSPYKRQRSFYNLLRQFLGLLRGHHAMIALMLASLTVSTLIGLLPLYGMKLVIDTALDDHPLPKGIPHWIPIPQDGRGLLTFVAVGMITLSTISMLLNMWGRWHATRIAKRLQVSVRRRVFDHAVRLPLHRVYELKSGGAASLLREDAGGVGDLVFAMLYNPWRAIVQLVGSLFILAATEWRLLLGSLVLIPAVYVTHKTWIGRIRPVFGDIRATRQYTDGHATETFGGMRVVRSFSRQRSESAQFTRNNDLMARQEILAWWWSRAIDIAWALLIPAATAGLLWYGGMRIMQDREMVGSGLLAPADALTTGSLVMFIAYVGWLLGPLEVLAASATAFQNHLAGLDRVLNVLEEPTEMPSKPGAIRLHRRAPAGHIAMHGVSYTYPKSPTAVLQNVSLDARPGEMIALVGPSGAGKTTLCNLIARFYDPTAGSITYGGVDLRDIEVDSYRARLGIVEQDTFLFDGTIAENIAYGRRHATLDEITQAARQANAHSFITELAKGYETPIGERGVKLSGGQRQRLTIARALLADPRILILDEATSNLDTESERLIQTSLRTLMVGRTSFVIAHRLSTIAHAHRIVVLEAGRIVEQGTHAELFARSGRYRFMVELQTAPPVPAPVVDDAEAERAVTTPAS